MEDPVADSGALTIVVVEHPSLAQILRVAFTTVWDNGLTFDQAYDAYVTSSHPDRLTGRGPPVDAVR